MDRVGDREQRQQDEAHQDERRGEAHGVLFGLVPSFTWNERSPPPRLTRTSIESPTLCALTIAETWSNESIGLPSIAVMMSPGCRPAASAGPPCVTSAISAPAGATPPVTSAAACTPRNACSTFLPCSRIGTTLRRV